MAIHVSRDQPQFGADLVIHSTTKYINGHSDVVGGCVVAATDELAEKIAYWANYIGITGAPFDSFLTLRGIRTLHPRIKQHEESASMLAHMLDQQSLVRKVYYPGLENHAGHDIAKRQQRGFGGMVSFEVAGGEEEIRAFVNSLKFFSLAESGTQPIDMVNPINAINTMAQTVFTLGIIR